MTPTPRGTSASRTVDAVWKLESARIVAALMRLVHDVGLAEELAQDALVAALEQWPRSGVPDNPGAWLTTIAKRRAVDHVRRARRLDRRHEQLAHELTQPPEPQSEPQSELGSEPESGSEPARDDVLRLMFISCHPLLTAEQRTALTLRVVAGLTAAEIARAFLTTEPATTQRITAAKNTLSAARVPFELPPPADLSDRLTSVLEVIYLIFNEGYSATTGDDLMRPELTLEALRLGRLPAELAPHEAEVHGLVALMEIQASRAAARTGPAGDPVQLHEQNRGLWDQLLIRRGFTAMLRARKIGGTPGPYVLQAAIAVCHAQARTAADTDWTRIASLYDHLAHLLPTPIVHLNRAVAVGHAHGPAAALPLVDALLTDPTLRDYHLLPGARGDLLTRLGRHAEAHREFERAATQARTLPETTFLRRRATHSQAAATQAAATQAAATQAAATQAAATQAAATQAAAVHDAAVQDAVVQDGALHDAAACDTADSDAVAADATVHRAADEDAANGGTAGRDAGRAPAGDRSVDDPAGVTLGDAADAFLARVALDPATLRSYGQTLRRLRRTLGDRLPLSVLTAHEVAQAFDLAWAAAASPTWNRHVAAARSFTTWSGAAHLAATLTRRPQTAPSGSTAPPGPAVPLDLAGLWIRADIPLRERTLWRLLHESAAAVSTVLALNVEDLDLDDRRAPVGAARTGAARVGPVRPGIRAGGGWVSWRAGTARLLPDLLAGRARGPLFLAERLPVPSRPLADADRCPETGRRRLSYERAEYLFKQATRQLDPAGNGYTLSRLRKSGG
ncbi:sigma-70 family RNA polymerase sigma factor [Micromonosporaceae bacterium Da 78-11]